MATVANTRTALLALIERLSGHAQVVWRDQADPFIDPTTNTIVRLHLRGFQSVATPEARRREIGTAPSITIATDIVDQKVFTLVVLVECLDQEVTAVEVSERIRTRLYRPASLAALRAVDCGLQLVGASQDLRTTYDKRVVSAASFDVRLAWLQVDLQEAFDDELTGDEVTDAATWIEHVEHGTDDYGDETISAPDPEE